MLIMGLNKCSSVNGPGLRAVIHFQGCSLGCKGCFNPQSHVFHEKQRISIGEIKDWIKNLTDVEGITFSGGEPMQQAPYLYVLVAWIRQYRPDLTIGMFTGYSKKELENGNFKWMTAVPETKDDGFQKGSKQLWDAIKEHLDFAVTGRYVAAMACHEEPLRGSRNQEVLFFTERYAEGDLSAQAAEVTVGEDGLIQITGFPTEEFLNVMAEEPAKPMSYKPIPCVKSDESDSEGELVGV